MIPPRLIVPALCVWAWLLPSASGQTGTVRANGIPVPGATVRATQGDKSLVTVTDENGRYHLDGITDGAWVLDVRMFRFAPARKEVQVKGAFDLDWTLTLQPLSAKTGGAGPRPAADSQAASPKDGGGPGPG